MNSCDEPLNRSTRELNRLRPGQCVVYGEHPARVLRAGDLPPPGPLSGDGSDDDDADPLDYIAFQADGHFTEAPADWGDPQQQLRSRQFFEILEACTDKMPPVQGRLFLMREWLELSSEEICKDLQLTPTNLYVQLHRARLRLRECMELNWFGKVSM